MTSRRERSRRREFLPRLLRRAREERLVRQTTCEHRWEAVMPGSDHKKCTICGLYPKDPALLAAVTKARVRVQRETCEHDWKATLTAAYCMRCGALWHQP